MKRRKVIFYLITAGFLLLCFGIVTLGIAEIYLRISGKYPTEYIAFDEQLIYRMKLGDRMGGFNNDVLLRINNEGFRGDEIEEKKKGSTRIAFLGDSYTAGLDYQDSQLFVNRSITFLDKDTDVINAAVPGWATDQHYVWVTKEMQHYQPDVLVWIISPNDIRESYNRRHVTLEKGKPVVHPNRFGQKERMAWWLRNHFHLFQLRQQKKYNEPFIYGIWRHYPVNFGIYDSAHWDLPLYLDSISLPEVEEAKTLFAQLAHEIKAACDAQGVKLVATAIPLKAEYTGKFGELGGKPGKMAHFIEQTCETEGIPFLNLNDKFRQHPDPASLYISWEFHFNEKGHALAGEEIGRFLQASLP